MSPFVDELHGDLALTVAEVRGEAFDGGDDIWREVPCSFDEFVTGPTHLRLGPLYPRQRAAMLELIGSDAQRIFEDPYSLDPGRHTFGSLGDQPRVDCPGARLDGPRRCRNDEPVSAPQVAGRRCRTARRRSEHRRTVDAEPSRGVAGVAPGPVRVKARGASSFRLAVWAAVTRAGPGPFGASMSARGTDMWELKLADAYPVCSGRSRSPSHQDGARWPGRCAPAASAQLSRRKCLATFLKGARSQRPDPTGYASAGLSDQGRPYLPWMMQSRNARADKTCS